MGSSPWSNQAVSLIILTEQTAGFSGIFGYSPAVGAGNLIFSLSAAAGTDPYGNAYPAGISGLGELILYGTGARILLYSGTPAAGNLIASLAPQSGTDPYGNAYPEGLQIGLASAGPQVALVPQVGNAAQVQFPIATPALSNVPNLAGATETTYASLLMSGPAIAAAGFEDWVQLALFSDSSGGSGASGQFINVSTGGGVSAAGQWDAAGWSFNGTVTFSGPVVVQGTLNAEDGITTDDLVVTGPATISGGISGGLTVTGGLDADDITVSGSTQTGTLYIDGQQLVIPQSNPTGINAPPSSYTAAWGTSVVNAFNNLRSAVNLSGLTTI